MALSRVVWQITSGPPLRPYYELFLRYGVALLGPGDTGAFSSERLQDPDYDDVIKRFAAELKADDAIVLRCGLKQLIAIGLVASHYEYQLEFDDVQGMDLQHCRRVRWFRLPHPPELDGSPFGASPPALRQCHDPAVLDYVHRFLASDPTDWQRAALPSLPKLENPLDRPPAEIAEVVALAKDLLGVYTNSDVMPCPPAENELMAHLVIPFLRALGWPAELIALEWECTDAALFSRLPRIPAHCKLIVEAKRLRAGGDAALKQARNYASCLGIRPDLLITDGIHYRLYAAEKDFAGVAYANLTHLKPSALNLLNLLRRS
jgi:hypothetical protein